MPSFCGITRTNSRTLIIAHYVIPSLTAQSQLWIANNMPTSSKEPTSVGKNYIPLSFPPLPPALPIALTSTMTDLSGLSRQRLSRLIDEALQIADADNDFNEDQELGSKAPHERDNGLGEVFGDKSASIDRLDTSGGKKTRVFSDFSW
jgi:hypothetical protein